MIGKTISHYKIIEKLGGGGMGVVYKARDTKLDRFVALKFLPPHLGNDAEEKQRFIHEAKAASALDHNNICSIYEIGETDDGQLFIVMAYYDGSTLKKKIDDGHLSIEEAIDIAAQVAAGLEKALEKGIVHRDIKPANVMITQDGVAKILDFGLAKLHGQSRLTKAGSTLGTAAYMSPEQARGVDVDARTDIFSLGAVFYEMLTGQIPFKGDYDQAVIYSLLNEDPQPISEIRSHVPKNIENVVKKCLEKEPDDRYQLASELLTELRGDTPRKKLATPKVRQRQQFIGLAIFSLVIMLAGIAYFSFFTGKKEESKERVPIAVVDFVNQTNEPELNGLSGMLITSLEQSRRLDVMSRARMFDELKKMGKPEVSFVDEATGREIAKQANVSALAVATIRKFGQLYTIDFKVIDPQSGDRLFSTKVEGNGQESIPGLIDQLSEKTRIDLREQPKSVQLTGHGVADVTTTNLEAYHHYFLGEQLMSQIKYQEAREEYRKAITLDSTFALAYYRLANALAWGFAEELAKKPLRKAFELIDRMPEKERYLLRALKARIEKGYAAGIPVAKEMEQLYPSDKEMLYYIGDWSVHASQYATAAEYLNKVLALDPTHEQALQHLCYTYHFTKQHDKHQAVLERLAAVNESMAYEERGFYHRSLAEYRMAIENFERAFKADSTNTNPLQVAAQTCMWSGQYIKGLQYAQKYLSLYPVPLAYRRVAQAYIFMGNFSNAERFLRLGLQHFPNSWLMGRVGEVSGFKGEYDTAEAQFKEMVASHQSADVKRRGFRWLARFYAYTGEYAKSNKMWDEKIALHLSDRDSNSVAEYTAEKAYRLYLGRRDKNQAYGELKRVAHFKDITNENYYFYLALVYNYTGDFEKANTAAEQVTNSVMKLEIESQALMQKKEWNKAIEVNKTLIQKWRPEAQTNHGYFSAVCYYEKGELDRAIDEAKKAASFYGWDHAYVYPHSFYLLGKIYEKKGDKQRAIENTEKFLDLWKDADPDLPDLIDAKERLARLKKVSSK